MPDTYPYNIGPLPSVPRGDRWQGVAQIGPVEINGDTPSNALTRIRMHFSLPGRVYRIDSVPGADALVVIDDAANWEAHIPPIDRFLPAPGVWEWDMEFWETGNAAPLTLYKGTIEVQPDVTK